MVLFSAKLNTPIGAETFVQATENTKGPAFVTVKGVFSVSNATNRIVVTPEIKEGYQSPRLLPHPPPLRRRGRRVNDAVEVRESKTQGLQRQHCNM
jgi:hypothetical protein